MLRSTKYFKLTTILRLSYSFFVFEKPTAKCMELKKIDFRVIS